jgi:hypothetical protein
MKKPMSFFLCWLCFCWLVILGTSIGVCVQALKITGQKQQYISLAKLVETGQKESGTSDITYQEYLQDFYGTIIETLESSEMRRRAQARLRSLHPDFKESEVTIKVTNNKGSSIFNVRAFGSEPKYTRYYLDALLDEFMAYRGQVDAKRNTAPVVKIMERASGAVEDLQEWGFPIAIGLIAGGLAGLLLSLLLAAILRSAVLRAATRAAQPPPLPTVE